MHGQALTHAEWLDHVPSLLSECATAWGLTPGHGYAPGAAGYATRVGLPDGTPAVLKLVYPDRESEQEADALERWDGDGAVRLLARDDARHALLLERCEPGAFLSGSPHALDVLIGLLPRLWKDPAGFHTLEEEAAHWLDVGVDDLAAGWIRELAPSQGELVLVHQDLHGDNVLSAEREPWLAIDPKPLAAEREFAVAPIVRSPELGHSRREVVHRLDRLSAELGLDRERARGWTIAQTLAWSEGNRIESHLEVVEWLR